ncbi:MULTISPECIES: vWA domain-containing protein [unclassified Acinetobacter]|uniref:vWA domain-containing protein n=1 Tax=unclassified Acinetobacter TaxID=196816 RepID=UPI002934C7A1|nr:MULTISPECIES: VWA domain-containing protein [unclassified Acinetobacter]WOE31934.1 VWA domain-containing protein [Acinetobacter sp. SAAs470]WOE37401.1 VWA domain-containing protein [Acinetobacter sp. SAAs474]
MFVRLLYTLRKYGVPVSTQELIDLNQAIAQGVVFADQTEFYQLAKIIMVKDERYFDKFDRAMKDYFDGLSTLDFDDLYRNIKQLPQDWFDLELLEKHLSQQQREQLKKADSLAELMKMLQQRLQEQHQKHQGGNRMIGTGGTSPFGAYGDHPEGIRIGGPGRKRSAVKVWEQRQYRNLDDEQILMTRQMQMALRRLRKFARQGAAEELDIGATIRETAKQGILDIQLIAERRNRVKVLMLFDVGGSMDPYIEQCQQLFSAAKNEFKSLDYFYFHNCIYDYVWTDNLRRSATRINTLDLLHTYSRDYRVIIVGDASMAPYELNSIGGSVEYMNEEAGQIWLQRLREHFDKTAWLNPEQLSYWSYTQTIKMIQTIFENHMYPMTLKGIEEMVVYLAR